MPPLSPQDDASIRPPHPLAQRLIDRLRQRPGRRVLDFCAGSGRNGNALRAAGFDVVTVTDAGADDPLPTGLRFAAAVSTHGLLHGTFDAIAGRVASLADAIDPAGFLYAAFGSVRDARFGAGRRIDRRTFAPIDGDELGVAHTYFTRSTLQALLEPRFAVELLEERDADAIAGSWAHPTPLKGAVHWFAIACVRLDSRRALSSGRSRDR